MTDTDKLSIIIKVMKLLRTGKIDQRTTNIQVLRLINGNNDKRRVHAEDRCLGEREASNTRRI